jgi:putative hydrolase of the HAD superfamily
VRRPRPTALLVDFDGVLRWWDPAVPAEVEAAYGLAPGVLGEALFRPDRLRDAVLGRLPHAAWIAEVAAQVGNPQAVRDWQRYRGEVDRAVLALVRDARAAGVPVALATNATDQLDADLVTLGLAGEFDAVANSSKLGVAKPSAEYYVAACELLKTPVDRCFLLDDSDRFVAGARAAGLSAHRYAGAPDLRYARALLAL